MSAENRTRSLYRLGFDKIGNPTPDDSGLLAGYPAEVIEAVKQYANNTGHVIFLRSVNSMIGPLMRLMANGMLATPISTKDHTVDSNSLTDGMGAGLVRARSNAELHTDGSTTDEDFDPRRINQREKCAVHLTITHAHMKALVDSKKMQPLEAAQGKWIGTFTSDSIDGQRTWRAIRTEHLEDEANPIWNEEGNLTEHGTQVLAENCDNINNLAETKFKVFILPSLDSKGVVLSKEEKLIYHGKNFEVYGRLTKSGNGVYIAPDIDPFMVAPLKRVINYPAAELRGI